MRQPTFNSYFSSSWAKNGNPWQIAADAQSRIETER
jgi:hypothetical protein